MEMSGFIAIFFFEIRRPLISTLFPYTTLFRSWQSTGSGHPSSHRLKSKRRFDSWGCCSPCAGRKPLTDRKSTRLNSSHVEISYAVFCLKKKMDITQAMLEIAERKLRERAIENV